MTTESGKRGEVKVRVHDKRRVPAGDGEHDPQDAAAPRPEPETREHDYLDDLRRLQAEFDNYKKRTIKEQTAVVERATQRLIERLLAVLDDFDRALAASADGGFELVYKQLKEVLTQEGLGEIPALGRPFDPQVHEAIESIEDESVTEPVVKDVYRTGYLLKGKVIRPAMVVVARPSEPAEDAGG
ncbi:MAG: nucleotide exchange factor GrpE [Actinomycetota bacterium]